MGRPQSFAILVNLRLQRLIAERSVQCLICSNLMGLLQNLPTLAA